MAARIRKGDTVEVITGVSKGKRGEVLRMMPEGRPRGGAGCEHCQAAYPSRRGMGQPGGIIEREATIHVSNLMLVDPTSEKRTKVGFRVLEDGRKIRVAKATGQTIES